MGNDLSASPQPYKPRKPFLERFMGKVDIREDGCWHWIAGKSSDGYGSFSMGGRRGGMRGAHVVAYEHFVGPVPDGMELDHTCRNRACVNPEHLDPVPHAVNVARGNWHGPAKLTPWQVAEIKRAYRAGGISQARLAAKFGVTQGLVWHIVNDRIWKTERPHLIEELGLEDAP